MKKLVIVICSAALSFTAYSQILKFSKDAVDPQGKKFLSGISFPGINGPNYYIDETNGGGAVFDGGVRDKLYSFDITSLAKKNDVMLNKQSSLVKADDYINITNILFADKMFTFFLNKSDDNVYPVYYQSFDADGKSLKEEKTSISIDNSKITTWNNKRDHAMLTAASFNVRKSFDDKRLITAVTSKTIDKNKSVISIAEWNGDMQATFSADYTVPLSKHLHFTKTIVGKMTENDFDDAVVLDMADDKNGFIYTLVQSGNPANADDANLFWIYQFKKSDKNYFKSYRAEFSAHMMPSDVQLVQSDEGNVCVTATGQADADEDKRNYFKVNSYYVGGFDADGKLGKLLGGNISMDLLDFFDGSDDKRQRKEDYINGLKLRLFHANSDGTMYVVWEQEWNYSKDGAVYSHDYAVSGNILVQYFNANKKIGWEKQVFKSQLTRGSGNSYSGLRCFFKNGNLFIFYPDDSRNASKDITDKKVEKFTLLKFGNKDLAGFFGLSFGNKGLLKRHYFAWPDERSGFAFNLRSIRYIGGSEFIAAARRLNQGALTVEEKEFTVLRFSL